MRRFAFLCTVLLLLLLQAPVLGQTRVLLTSCREFASYPSLGYEASGNLQFLASVFSASGVTGDSLDVEDGTLSSFDALSAVTLSFFSGAQVDDLSVFYLCTHGVLSEDGGYQLILSDGAEEEAVSAGALLRLLASLPGQTLLILDACHSGAVLSYLTEDQPSLSVLTSSSSSEAAWYYLGEGVQSGALSYFASSFCTALGLYGPAEADRNGDRKVTLDEVYHQLLHALPSSTVQISSNCADTLVLPSVKGAAPLCPLTDFSYGQQLLARDACTLSFSFTLRRPVSILYRLIEYTDRGWDWAGAFSVREPSDPALQPGRMTRSFSLDADALIGDYFILQVFSVEEDALLLCSEKLFALCSNSPDNRAGLSLSGAISPEGRGLALRLSARQPVLCSVFSRSLMQEEVPLLTGYLYRPSADGANTLSLSFPPRRFLPPGSVLRIEVEDLWGASSYEVSLTTDTP
ncbi:MAG: hypothetical protein IJ573_08660 [Clostridia bacterium]|nr:hypothetical protein [Clostridia bacterium]